MSLDLVNAGETVGRLNEVGDPGQALRSSVKGLKQLYASAPNEMAFRKQALSRLPRYKALL